MSSSTGNNSNANGTSDDTSITSSEHTLSVLITVIGVVFVVTFFLSLLFTVRRKRQLKAQSLLPVYATGNSSSSQMINAKGLTIQTTGANGRQSVLVFGRDGQPMLANPQLPPYSPDNVPEIRITFPDEHDESGHRKSGRVVIVRLGEHNAVGMEPVREEEEQLPAYEKESKSQFYSIDMDQIGGLKEKMHQSYQ